MMDTARWISVSTPYVTPRSGGEPEAWQAEAAAKGGVGTQRLLDVREVTPTPEVTQALGITDGGPVVVRRRLMLFDEQPVELTASFYPLAIAAGTPLAEPRKIRGGAVTLLSELGYRPVEAREEVYARRPDEEERSLLQLSEHDWVLGLTRLLLARDDLPVELSVMSMLAHGRRLRYQLTIE